MTLKIPFKKLFARRKRSYEIHPDEIFLDARNLPEFNTHQFEGRIEKPISKPIFKGVAAFFLVVALIFIGKLWNLQVKMGEAYSIRSASNHLRHTTIFAERGVIYDRKQVPLAWNELNAGGDFSLRAYASTSGISHVVGYLKYPSKDSSGIYYQERFVGKAGVEEYYDHELSGENGLKITETDALGAVQSESVLSPPKEGDNLSLSIDVRVQAKLAEAIAQTVTDRDFVAGAGVIMDVHNGEILALTSFPEYDPNVMTSGQNAELIGNLFTDPSTPFLNRVVAGQYIPGSIIKPFIAMGVLEEDIIDPLKQIESIGYISIPNPYDPEKKTIFRDWKVHGFVDLRHAIAVSSDEYFYTVGGGYGGQEGLGINNIDKYVRAFGFGQATGIDLFGEQIGNIPSPAWKKEVFNGEIWRLGDTYNSSIGQYGFQVTPIQVARAVGSFANGGTLVKPTLVLHDSKPASPPKALPFDPEHFQIIREAMRLAVTEGTARGLDIPGFPVAGKTGTAELGVSKAFVNSWVVGFFPYQNPRFSFAVLMEEGPRNNTVGATYIMRQMLDWMLVHTPEYVR